MIPCRRWVGETPTLQTPAPASEPPGVAISNRCELVEPTISPSIIAARVLSGSWMRSSPQKKPSLPWRPNGRSSSFMNSRSSSGVAGRISSSTVTDVLEGSSEGSDGGLCDSIVGAIEGQRSPASQIPHLDKRKTSLAPATKRAKMFLDQEKRSPTRCSYYEARLTGIPVRAGEGLDGYDGAVRPDDVPGVDASSGFEVIGRAPRETAGERSGLDGQPDDHLADAAELGRRRVGVRP